MTSGEVVLSADDTDIPVTEKNENTLQDKMMQLRAWFSANNMAVNSESFSN
jgi:hypothetical protein